MMMVMMTRKRMRRMETDRDDGPTIASKSERIGEGGKRRG